MIQFHEQVHEAVNGPEQRHLLKKRDPAVVRQHLPQQLADDDAAILIRRGRVDDDGFAEEVIDHGVDAPLHVGGEARQLSRAGDEDLRHVRPHLRQALQG